MHPKTTLFLVDVLFSFYQKEIQLKWENDRFLVKAYGIVMWHDSSQSVHPKQDKAKTAEPIEFKHLHRYLC